MDRTLVIQKLNITVSEQPTELSPSPFAAQAEQKTVQQYLYRTSVSREVKVTNLSLNVSYKLLRTIFHY